MKTQLIKLQDKFILVSDEEIKEGDRFYSSFKGEHRMLLFNKQVIPFPKDMKIISENPDFSLLKEEDCKEIGFIDVDKLFDKELSEETPQNYDEHLLLTTKHGFEKGFKSAQSLNDKCFSEQQVIDIVEKSRATGLTAEFLIQRLQQTSWDVEVEMVIMNKGYTDKSDYPYQECSIPKITNGSIKLTKIL